MKLIFSGLIIPISTIDWYGRSVSVVFFNGCNFKCLYCSNNEFIRMSNPLVPFFREKKGRMKKGKNKIVSSPLEPLFKKGNVVDMEDIEKQILDAKSFISAVVFSGGEPTTPSHFEGLERLARFAKDHGLLVGIETNGYYPERLSSLIEKKLLDKIFLDIKAPLDDAQSYSTITGGIEDAAERAHQSFNLKNVSIEVRTTVFRSFADVSGVAKFLKGHDCTYVIQQGIPEYALDKKIRQEKPFTREELVALAKSVSFLKDVRVRTREKGEEKII
ncbi:MAG: radical SAM protein [Candidatus Methanoperedens sp.]|nr:radical SAM protein [Candidatus Methanoperedens sp.]MCZ7395677.1 radical SAM protein [Candidatus Methanoperedens sp.]